MLELSDTVPDEVLAEFLETVEREGLLYEETLYRDVVTKGGPGSGNFGHEGRPGEVGGSGEGGGGVSNQQVYHGGTSEHSAAVTYYTINKEMAQSYVEMSNDRFGSGGELHEARITIAKPATQDVISREALKVGIENEMYTPASVFDSELHGETEVKQLVRRLTQLGYDGAVLTDIAYGKEIEDKAYIVFHGHVAKASPPLWRQIHEIADRAEPKVRAVFLKAIAATQDAMTEAAVIAALERGDLEAAYNAIPWEDVGAQALRDALPDTIASIMSTAGDAAMAHGALASLGLRFDLDNPRAITWANEHSATLIQQVSDETKAGIRHAIATAIRQGTPPAQSARMLRHMVGLTESQSETVGNYWAQLETEDRDPDQVDRMVRRYAERVHNQRAETIARTETITSANYGQQEAWQQAQDEGLLPADAQRVWLAIDDGRTDDVCLRLDGMVAGIDEPFTDPETGDTFMNPGYDVHPNCRCAQGIASAEDVLRA
jgi:hypothetical protein